MLDLDKALKFLKYGAMGVGALLAILAFGLLNKAIAKDSSSGVLALILVFILFSFTIVIFTAIKEIHERRRDKQLVFEVDPCKENTWGKDGNFEFRWFNAPYGLAIEELGRMNMRKIKIKNVSYRLLLVGGIDKKGKEEFKYRFDRMLAFLRYMKSKDTPIKGIIQVGVLENTRTPTHTYYLLRQEGKKSTIFYLESMVTLGGKSQIAFKTFNKSVYNSFDSKFEEDWRDAKKIDLAVFRS